MDSGARLPFDFLQASAEWGARLSSVRLPIPSEDIDAARLERCHRQFREISQRTRSLWNRSEFQAAAVPHIARLGEQSLALSRMICDELVAHTVNAGIFLPVPMDVLEELLAANAVMLDWITDRLEAVAAFTPIATELRSLVEAIVIGKERSFRPMRSLVAEFISLVEDGPELSFRTTADAAVLSEVFGPPGVPRTDWFAQSLFTGWLLARSTTRGEFSTEVGHRLVMAALAQDFGGWTDPVRSKTQADPRIGVPRLPPYHPSTGAAMLSGLSDTPAEVSLLVGAHHERCDGSGFPQRLSGARFTPSAQRLAWTVRLAELLLDPLTSELSINAGDAVDTLAGLRLWREVTRGAFDPQAVRDWLSSIRPGLADEVITLFPKLQRRFVDPPHRQAPMPHAGGMGPRRVDGTPADEAVAAPQFLRRGGRIVSRSGSMAVATREDRPS